MKETIIDTLLISIFAGLGGYLLGTTLSGINIRVSDVSSIILATAAAYGVISWRKQHDYQQKNSDRKTLIKLIKKSLTLALKSRNSRAWLSYDLEQYAKTKSKLFEQKTEHTITNLIQIEQQISELKSDLEAEIANNYIVDHDKDVLFKINCLLQRLEDISISLNLLVSIYQSFKLMNIDEHARFQEMKEEADQSYVNFLDEFKPLTVDLGIDEDFKARSKSFQHLYKDSEEK